MNWLTLGRPLLGLAVLGLPSVGLVFGLWDYALDLTDPVYQKWGRLLLAWAALHFGTMWINADYDRDEGEVLGGEAAEVPAGMRRAGHLMLALAVVIAGWVSVEACAGAAVCAVLSELYSWPGRGWKGGRWTGPLVNWAGYGLISPWVGWTLVQVPASARGLCSWAVVQLGVLSAYGLAQVFQETEDRARGYSTWVVRFGPAGTLAIARTLLFLCWLLTALMMIGRWLPLALVPALMLWPWLLRPLRRPTDEAPRVLKGQVDVFVRRISVVLFVALAGVLGDYAQDLRHGRLAAGLGTGSGAEQQLLWRLEHLER